MKKFSVSSVFTLKDKFSSPLKKMGQNMKGFGASADKTKGKLKKLDNVKLNKLKFKLNNLKGRFGDLKNNISKVGLTMGALVGGASIAGLKAMIFSTTKLADEMQKLSQRTGIGVESLQGLMHAANLSGVDEAAFKGSMRRFTKRAVDAGNGIGKQVIASYKKLGISKDEFVSASQEERLMLVAKRWKNVESEAERARVAQHLFGDEGVKMANMLAGGYDGIQAAMQEARDLGLVLTDDQTKQAEKFNDQVTRVGGAFVGIKNLLSIQLLPTLKKYLDLGLGWIKQNKELVLTGLKVAAGIGLAVGGLIALGVVFTVIGSALSIFMALFSPLGLVIAAFALIGYKIYQNWEPIKQLFSDFSKDFPALTRIFNVLGAVADSVFGVIKSAFESVLVPATSFMDIISDIFGVLESLAGSVVGSKFFKAIEGGLDINTNQSILSSQQQTNPNTNVQIDISGNIPLKTNANVEQGNNTNVGINRRAQTLGAL